MTLGLPQIPILPPLAMGKLFLLWSIINSVINNHTYLDKLLWEIIKNYMGPLAYIDTLGTREKFQCERVSLNLKKFSIRRSRFRPKTVTVGRLSL